MGGVQYKDPAGTVVGTTAVRVDPGAAMPAPAGRAVSTRQLSK
jgi:hypothetical protein